MKKIKKSICDSANDKRIKKIAEQQHATPDEDDEIKLENNFTQLSRNLTISTKHAHPDQLLLTVPAHTVVLFEGSLQGQVWSMLKCRFQCAFTHNQQFCLSNFCFPSKFDSILQNLLGTLLLCCNTELVLLVICSLMFYPDLVHLSFLI